MAMPGARGRIALSMIVRDEEDVLGRCLDSARDWVGEVVVVDTGSRDRSVAIAESFGARVIPFTWCDDFSAPRNASLEAASLPWALVLDADEELVVEDASAFERAVTEGGPAGFSLTLNNQLEHGLSADFRVFRLFRRDIEGMRYRGQLHEQIVAVAEKRVATAHLHGIRILHHGHTAQRVAQKDKGARNLRLAHALVATRPEDPFAWFSLAREQGPDCTASCRRALELLDASGQGDSRDDWILHLYVDLCKALRREGQDAEAENVIERGLVLFPHSPDLRFARGQRHLAKGNAAGAAEDFARCLSTDGKPSPLVVNPAVVGHAAREQLAVALAHLGRRVEAIAHLERAAEEAPPGDPTALRLLGMMRLLDGRASSAVEACQRAIEQAPAEGALRLELGRALLAAGDFGPALVALAHPCAPSAARTILQRTVLDLLARVPRDARAALNAWHEVDPCSADACYWLGHAALEERDAPGAARWWRRAVELEPSHCLAVEGLSLLG